jgi:hypothetical protein
VEALSLLACCFISWVIWPLLGMVCAGGRWIAGAVLGGALGPLGVLLCFFLPQPGESAEHRAWRERRLVRRIREELRAEREAERITPPPDRR